VRHPLARIRRGDIAPKRTKARKGLVTKSVRGRALLPQGCSADSKMGGSWPRPRYHHLQDRHPDTQSSPSCSPLLTHSNHNRHPRTFQNKTKKMKLAFHHGEHPWWRGGSGGNLVFSALRGGVNDPQQQSCCCGMPVVAASGGLVWNKRGWRTESGPVWPSRARHRTPSHLDATRWEDLLI